jgi:hypothetical protein
LTTADAVNDNIDLSNELYAKVANTLEAALDSKLLILTSDISTQKARRLRLDQHLFDSNEFVTRIVVFASSQDDETSQRMDWDAVGDVARRFMQRAPPFQAMLGPLDVQVKERKPTQRGANKLEVQRETRPQELQERDMVAQENETTRNVKHLGDLLSSYDNGINLFEFVLNPQSFGQSVENLFHASFLIRDGRASIDTETGLPIIFATEAPTQDDYTQGVQKRQFVLELDVDTWRRLIQKYKITKSIIPHRQETDKNVSGKWYG